MRPLLLALALTGCSLRPVQRGGGTITAALLDAVACDKLDRSVMGWTAATMALGVLAGSTGVTAALTDNVPRYVTSGVSIGLGSLTAITTYLSTAYAQRYVRGCTIGANP